MKSVSELLLHLDSFVNVALPQQGLYCLHLSLSSKGRSKAIKPLRVQCNHNGVKDCHSLKSPVCLEAEAYSACFFIRYAEEKAKLEEVLTYRLTSTSDLRLTVRLLFHETFGCSSLAEAKQLSSSLEIEDYAEVSRTTVCLDSLSSSYHEYVGALFPDPQLSVVHFTVHSALVDFRLSSLDSDVVDKWNQIWFFENLTGRLSQTDAKAACEQQLMQLVLSSDKLRTFLTTLPKLGDIPSRPALEVCDSPWSTEQLKTQVSLKMEGMSRYEGAEYLLQVCLLMSSYLVQLSDSVESALLSASQDVCHSMRQASLVKVKEAYSLALCRSDRLSSDCAEDNKAKKSKHIGQVKAVRQRLGSSNLELNAYDVNMFKPLNQCPIFFEDCLLPEHSPTPSAVGVHLVILVHGFQGSPGDLKQFKNNLALIYPDNLVFCSSCNEDDTGDSLELMGERLSLEVTSFISDRLKGNVAKLSFIGYSIGGLIIRSALPHLGALSDKMHSYISLSSPHLGCLYQSSRLVDLGLRVLRSWNKSESLSQLAFKDAGDIEETFMYRLSCYPGLSWFRHVVMLSSCQDQFISYDSARNEIPAKAAKDLTRGGQVTQMVDNFNSMLFRPQVLKLDVHFTLKHKNLASVIGKAAHIQFIDDPVFIRQFLVSYPDLFN
jgi:hypothetical protein